MLRLGTPPAPWLGDEKGRGAHSRVVGVAGMGGLWSVCGAAFPHCHPPDRVILSCAACMLARSPWSTLYHLRIFLNYVTVSPECLKAFTDGNV